MPRQIWNEGRVVGYSAYEVYVKHSLSVDPKHTPASEKEWLASMMAMGSSMLLRIGTDTIDGFHYRDIQFPSDCRLCAANTIMASLFDGEGYVGTNNPVDTLTSWATKITSYGSLINNTSLSSPSGKLGTNGAIPPDNTTLTYSPEHTQRIKEYLKIVDGIIIQPGTWVDNPNKPPQKDFSPTLSEHPRLRIAFSERVTTPFFLLLTGFTNRTVVDGVIGFDTAVNTQSSSDGDFLGPWAFPWSAKVIFSVPSSFVNQIMVNKYTRAIPKDNDVVTVDSDTIIDMNTTNPSDYYSELERGYKKLLMSYDNPGVEINISELKTMGKEAAALAIYRYPYSGLGDGNRLPGALYGSKLTNTGKATIYPIDTVSPGTLKMYHYNISDYPYDITRGKLEETFEYIQAVDSELYTPYNYSLLRDANSYVISELKIDKETENVTLLPVSDDTTENIQSLKMNNMPYMWFFQDNGGSYDNVNAVFLNKFLYGTVSQNFVDEFCFSDEDIKTIYNNRYNTPTYPISGLAALNCGSSSLYNMYVNIHESERQHYNYFLLGGFRVREKCDAQYFFVPVHKVTNIISVILPESTPITKGNTSGLKFKTDNALDYLGSWFNGTDIGGGLCNRDELKEHPQQQFAIPTESVFYTPRAATPKPPTEYKHDFLTWFKNESVTKKMIPSSRFAEYGIDASYKDLTIYEFLRYCCTRDLSKPYKSDKSFLEDGSSALVYKRYLYTRDAINKLKITSSEQNNIFDEGHTLTSTVYMKACSSSTNFFYDAKVQFTSVSSDEDDKAGANIGNLNDKYVDSTNAVWSSVGTSGDHCTYALSLIDGDGVPLSQLGSAGEIEVDKIIWNDLIRALNNNLTLDILGKVLKGIKIHLTDSSDNYLQFANGLRVYFSKSAPTDARDGDIGIGW